MSNKCSNPRCLSKGSQMILKEKFNVFECEDCKSRSCSHNEPDTFWYKCTECKEVGIYNSNQSKINCEYCGSDKVQL